MLVTIAIDERGADRSRVQELTRDVRQELLRLDVARAPIGARGIDVAAAGTLTVSPAGSSGAVTRLITALQAWVGRGRRGARTVTLTVGDHTLRITDATLDQPEHLVDEFSRLLRA